MRIVLVGLEGIGRELAKILTQKSDNEVVLIDSNEEITENVSEEYDAVTITGDGSNPETLKQAKLEEADALVAVTESDSINLVIAMIAKQWDVENIIIKLSKTSLKPAGQEIIKDIIVVMPDTSAANEIVQSLYGKQKSNIAEAIGGALYQDILELGETDAETIKDLDLPEDCLAIAISRGDNMILAKGDQKIEKGDGIIFLFENKKTIEKIKKRLVKK